MENILPPTAFEHPSPLLPPPPSSAVAVINRQQKPLPASIDSLPEELLFEILARLPADFLFKKARFVCPKWNKIIRSQAFINVHGDRHSTYGLLLTSYLNHDGRHRVYVLGAQGRIETRKLSYSCNTTILTSSNGLALELVRSRGAFPLRVINPATKQPFVLPSSTTGDGNDICYNSSAIAYSAATKKYKVALPYDLEHRLGLDILTIGVDELWRKVEVDHIPEEYLFLSNCDPLNTEGFVHWGRGRDVLTLDVETEILALSQVPVPNSCSFKYYYLSTGKRLSMLLSGPDHWWEVWEMTPENQKWRKALRCRIDLVGDPECEFHQLDQNTYCEFCLISDSLRPIGWVKYLEVLAFIKPDGTGILYNLVTHYIKTIELPDISNGVVHRNTLARLC